jgi:diguanylate cyclase (GGDEF)-like protein/PAS domain S-box-containing protein
MLEQENSAYQQLFDRMGDAGLIIKDGTFIKCNPAAVALLEFPNEESLINHPPGELSPPLQSDGQESGPKAEKMIAASIDVGPQCFEWVHLKYDGTPITVEVMLTPIDIGGERLIHVLWRDLTARLKVEKALKKSQSMLHVFQETNRDAWMTVSEKGFLDCNEATLELFGCESKEHFCSLGPSDLSPERQPNGELSSELANKNFVKAISDGKNRFDWQHTRHDTKQPFDAEVLLSRTTIAGDTIVQASVRDNSDRKAAEKALKESEKKLQTMYDSHMEAWALMDENGFLECNKVCVELYGAKSKKHFCTLHPKDISPEKQPNGDDSNELKNRLIGEAFEKGSSRFEWQQKRFDNNKTFFTEILFSRVILGDKVLVQANIRNIDDRKRAEAASQNSEKNLRTLFESSRDAWLLLDDNGIFDANQSALTLYGCDDIEALKSLSVEDRSSPIQENGEDSKELSKKHIKKAFDIGSNQFEWKIKNQQTNKIIDVEVLLSTVEINGRIILQSTAREITERKEMEAKVEKLAYEDDLTGLVNRRTMLERLTHILNIYKRTNNNGALLFIDLDHFKVVNDTMGHSTGDAVLKQVAERLKGSVREGDSISRFGGDEFVVMLEELDHNSIRAARRAETVCENLLVDLNTPYKIDGRDLPLTASIGVTMFSGDSSAKDLLQQSDIAMYQAKAAGRNTVRFFDPKMQAAVDARANTEQLIKNALSNNLFELHYQLQINSDGQVLGAEALLRLHHPTKKYIPPMEYIPVAEETGLIVHIGNWVLNTACQQLNAWQKQPSTEHLSIAVNVSSIEFKQPEFVDNVLRAIKASDIDPKQLKLELTETMLVEDIDDIIVKMNQLKDTGVQFSLDDFGTGYSSLQYLKQLPLDQLKVDQSFVRDLEDDPQDRSIVKTIISMAKGLELDIIAEGVETVEQQKMLLAFGCPNYQGYLFAKPMPIKDFNALIQEKLAV